MNSIAEFRSYRRWLAGTLVLFGALWLWFGRSWLVPAVIDGHRGVGSLQKMIGAHRPLDAYLFYFEGVVVRVAVAFAVVALLVLTVNRTRLRQFFHRFVGTANAQSVAAARIVASFILLTSALWEDVPSTALLPRELIHPHGLMNLFHAIPSFEHFVADGTALGVFQATTVGLLALALVGLKTRLVVPLAAVAYYVLAGIMRQYAWSYHTGLIPLYVMVVLSFVRCGDAWSVDSWLQRRRSNAETIGSPVHYGWARFSVAVVVALPYFEAGLSKLCNGGLLWWSPTNMRAILFTDSLNPMETDFGIALKFVEAPDIVFAALGLAAVGGELAMLFVLTSRWGKLICPAMMISMHVGILITQNILFFDLIILNGIFYVFAYIDRTGGPWDYRALLRRRSRTDRTFDTAEEVPARGQPGWLAPRALAGLVGILAMCWVFAVEFFPLTAMQMYSRRNVTGELEYFRVVAHRASGETARAYPEKVIPAVRDSRYRRVIRLCFAPEQVSTCQEFLKTTGDLLNQRAAPSPIERLEVQRVEWNFREDPTDPHHGKVRQRFVVDLT